MNYPVTIRVLSGPDVSITLTQEGDKYTATVHMGYSHAAVEAYDPVRAGAGRAETSRADRGNRQEGTGKRARKAGKVSGRFRLKQQRGKFGVNLGKFEVKQTERVMLAEDEQE